MSRRITYWQKFCKNHTKEEYPKVFGSQQCQKNQERKYIFGHEGIGNLESEESGGGSQISLSCKYKFICVCKCKCETGSHI